MNGRYIEEASTILEEVEYIDKCEKAGENITTEEKEACANKLAEQAVLDIAQTVKQTKREEEMMVAFNNTVYIVTQEQLMKKTLKEMKKTKVHIRDSGKISSANCDIDETINRKLKPYKAHSCINSEECKGERQCTAFGWCRGKAMCNEYSK